VPDHSIRASDADRERVARILRGHAVAGRLTLEELDERTGRALGARTLGELDALQSDLPRERRRGRAPATAAALLLAETVLWVLIGVVIVTIAILWALAWTGARLAAAVAARVLDSRRAPALRAGP
jgi:Domain of unknown function (DUF1707)